MPEILIHDVPVEFPFEPYDVQKVYMEKVIECLQSVSRSNLIHIMIYNYFIYLIINYIYVIHNT
jgi:hypothetical protein